MRVTPIGELQASSVAFLASVSALSFPLIPEWLGHHDRVTLIRWSAERRRVTELQKDHEYNWPADGVGRWMAVRADAQSVKM